AGGAGSNCAAARNGASASRGRAAEAHGVTAARSSRVVCTPREGEERERERELQRVTEERSHAGPRWFVGRADVATKREPKGDGDAGEHAFIAQVGCGGSRVLVGSVHFVMNRREGDHECANRVTVIVQRRHTRGGR